MNFKSEISNLLKNELVIRHRSHEEIDGAESRCCFCSRLIKMVPGDLCISVASEGLLCSICATTYAPEMARKMIDQLPVTEEDPAIAAQDQTDEAKSIVQWEAIAKEINSLREISSELAKGIARGIVEAPAGHIGLLHFAKDIQKPQRKENESEKEYALRVRTYRMTKLYDIISSETVARIDTIKNYLVQLGFPIK